MAYSVRSAHSITVEELHDEWQPGDGVTPRLTSSAVNAACAGARIRNVVTCTNRWLVRKYNVSVVHPWRNVLCCGRSGHNRSIGTNSAASSSTLSANQSNPSEGASLREREKSMPLPPRIEAIEASVMPSSPSTLRRRSAVEMRPSTKARMMTAWRIARAHDNGSRARTSAVVRYSGNRKQPTPATARQPQNTDAAPLHQPEPNAVGPSSSKTCLNARSRSLTQAPR